MTDQNGQNLLHNSDIRKKQKVDIIYEYCLIPLNLVQKRAFLLLLK